MKRFIIPSVAAVFLLVIFITILFFIYLNRNKNFEDTEPIGSHVEQESTSVKPFAIQEVKTNRSVVSGEEASSSKAFVQLQDSTFAKPNAFQIKATYNQSEVEITDISKGDVWADYNVLSNSIDASTGTIKFAAGQGFSAQESGGMTLFIVTYNKKINTSGNIGLIIHPESKFGFTNQSQLQSLSPSVLSVVLE